MKKSRMIIQRIVALILIILSLVLQILAAGTVFNGATIVAILFLTVGLVLLVFDFKKIRNWIKTELFSFNEYEFDGIDVIPWIDPSEYDGEKKEGIILQFPKSDK